MAIKKYIQQTTSLAPLIIYDQMNFTSLQKIIFVWNDKTTELQAIKKVNINKQENSWTIFYYQFSSLNFPRTLKS